MALEEENEMITNDGKLAQTFNEYFVNIVPSLGIFHFPGCQYRQSCFNYQEIKLKKGFKI